MLPVALPVALVAGRRVAGPCNKLLDAARFQLQAAAAALLAAHEIGDPFLRLCQVELNLVDD